MHRQAPAQPMPQHPSSSATTMSVQVDARQQRAHTGSQDTCARASSLLPVPPAPRTPRTHHTRPQGTYGLEVTEEGHAPTSPRPAHAPTRIIISNHNVSTSRCTATARTQARKTREREPPLSSPFHLPHAPPCTHPTLPQGTYPLEVREEAMHR